MTVRRVNSLAVTWCGFHTHLAPLYELIIAQLTFPTPPGNIPRPPPISWCYLECARVHGALILPHGPHHVTRRLASLLQQGLERDMDAFVNHNGNQEAELQRLRHLFATSWKFNILALDCVQKILVYVSALEAELEPETWEGALCELGVQTDVERYQRIKTWIESIQQIHTAERAATKRHVRPEVGLLGKRKRDDECDSDEQQDNNAGDTLQQDKNAALELRKPEASGRNTAQAAGTTPNVAHPDTRGRPRESRNTNATVAPEAGYSDGDGLLVGDQRMGDEENAAGQEDDCDDTDTSITQWNADRRNSVVEWVEDIRAKRRRISKGDVC
ncbi:hypothetical protein BV22DRAFT_1051497 [Leucogyrophana mollusca]|uniref:Uncharacterized protein n=1 Tax=Leucogyrophana mollusca TaxID=85980 RepID=A0ACB8AZG4_9AGAM|nr:hypothetical protein BV22DRAFT_1051497 [Leucogyrophana mollusca]